MKFRIVALLAVFLTVPSLAHAASKAEAQVINSQGKNVGKAVFTESGQGVLLSLDVSGLTPGVHAMHIHDKGTCTPPDFKSAGSHFNPEGKKHGKDNPEGAHAGDLPNIAVAGNGKGRINVLLPSLQMNGPAGILKPGKTALVIHAGPDDEVTDPAGNAGDRVACGVIG